MVKSWVRSKNNEACFPLKLHEKYQNWHIWISKSLYSIQFLAAVLEFLSRKRYQSLYPIPWNILSIAALLALNWSHFQKWLELLKPTLVNNTVRNNVSFKNKYMKHKARQPVFMVHELPFQAATKKCASLGKLKDAKRVQVEKFKVSWETCIPHNTKRHYYVHFLWLPEQSTTDSGA